VAWGIGWAGAAAVAVGNGALRDLLLADALGERQARQLSTVTLLILLASYLWWLNRTWTLPTTAVALRVGAAWAVTTLLFEFGLGHYVEHKSWSVLFGDYDLTQGHIWILVPIWTAIGPAVVQRLQARRHLSAVPDSESVRTNH
jgi:hypothetical protein